MIIKWTLIISACFASWFSSSQVIAPVISTNGEFSIVFERDFIESKNIRKIESKFSSKKPNQIIKPNSKDSKFMIFNDRGDLIEHSHKYYISENLVDHHEMFDFNNGSLLSKTEKDHIGYFRSFFESSGDTTFVNIYRAEEYDFYNKVVSDSTWTNSSFNIKNDSIIRFFNKNKTHVKTQTITRNGFGLVTQKLIAHTFSPNLVDLTYEYNELGLVSEVSLASISQNLDFRYTYNKTENLERVEYYSKDELIQEYEIVYDSNGWADAIIKHDIPSHIIYIEELEYTIK